MAKADTAKNEAPAPDAGGKPKKKKILILAVILVLLLGAGGGAAWYFLKGKTDKKPVEEVLNPVFVPLDTFTVNLQKDPDDHVLQVGLSLKIYKPELEEKIKNAMPEIRNALLLLLSSKRASELSTITGKVQLAGDIISSVDGVLGIPHKSSKPMAVQPPSIVPPVAAVPSALPQQPVSVNSLANTVAVQNPPPPPPVASAPPPVAPVPEPEDKNGVAGVLFSSFIIQ